MPLFLSEIDGSYQGAFFAAGNYIKRCLDSSKKHSSVCINAAGGLLRVRPPETHPDCNISRVDTHCKHQLHCTECPFTGDDVYRRFIFNLLSPILNGERWIYEIQIKK